VGRGIVPDEELGPPGRTAPKAVTASTTSAVLLVVVTVRTNSPVRAFSAPWITRRALRPLVTTTA